MTEGFQTVLAASEKERRDLFIGAADRLRTNEQNIEKDFWVCWTLDALFNELEAGGPRLLFKGGTSLSTVAGCPMSSRKTVMSMSSEKRSINP